MTRCLLAFFDRHSLVVSNFVTLVLFLRILAYYLVPVLFYYTCYLVIVLGIVSSAEFEDYYDYVSRTHTLTVGKVF